jgi:hypothetical protein
MAAYCGPGLRRGSGAWVARESVDEGYDSEAAGQVQCGGHGFWGRCFEVLDKRVMICKQTDHSAAHTVHVQRIPACNVNMTSHLKTVNKPLHNHLTSVLISAEIFFKHIPIIQGFLPS